MTVDLFMVKEDFFIFQTNTRGRVVNTKKIILGSVLSLIAGFAIAADTSNMSEMEGHRPYNKTMNPRQKEYPSHQGFNDLHIRITSYNVCYTKLLRSCGANYS